MEAKSTTVDTHLHLWDLSRFAYAWIEAGTILGRSYLAGDALPLMRESGIEACVLVEAGADDPGELYWLLEMAAAHDPIAGAVAWVDPNDDIERVLETVGARLRPFLKGIRINCFDPDEDWSRLANRMRALAHHQLSCDLLVGAGVLLHVKDLIKAHPRVTFVLDHLGGISITPGGFSDWKQTLCDIAELPNAVMKVSGYLTAAHPRPPKASTLQDYLNLALDCFGARRLMYGSDWPVCQLGGAYADTVKGLRAAAGALSPDEQAEIWGAAAARIYRLDF